MKQSKVLTPSQIANELSPVVMSCEYLDENLNSIEIKHRDWKSWLIYNIKRYAQQQVKKNTTNMNEKITTMVEKITSIVCLANREGINVKYFNDELKLLDNHDSFTANIHDSKKLEAAEIWIEEKILNK